MRTSASKFEVPTVRMLLDAMTPLAYRRCYCCATNQYWTATAAIASNADAKANPTSRPLTPPPDDGRGAGRAAGAAAGAAGTAGFDAGAAGIEGAAFAAGTAAAGAAATGAAGAGAAGAAVGIRIDGPAAGFGGRLMRTVCFFCTASPAGGVGGVGGLEYFRT